MNEKITRMLESSDLEIINLGIIMAEEKKVSWEHIVNNIPPHKICTIYRHKITSNLSIKHIADRSVVQYGNALYGATGHFTFLNGHIVVEYE